MSSVLHIRLNFHHQMHLVCHCHPAGWQKAPSIHQHPRLYIICNFADIQVSTARSTVMTLECPLITTHHHKHDKIHVTCEVSHSSALLMLSADLTVVLLEHTSHFYLWLCVCFRSMTVQSVAMCQEHSRQSQKTRVKLLECKVIVTKIPTEFD